MAPLEEIHKFAATPNPPEMLRRLVQFWKFTHTTSGIRIRDANEDLVSLRLNLAQEIVLLAAMRQAADHKPIRITILKARKVGISTEIETLCVVIAALVPNQQVKLIAHRDESTREIFEIATRCAKHLCDGRVACDPLSTIIRWPEVESAFHAQTAGGEGVSAGGTPNIVHLSEVAKWKLNKRETWYNALNAVPRTLTSAVFIESTAKGRDLFYEHWDASQHPDSQYTAVFIPWFYDERCEAPVAGRMELDDEEGLLVRRASGQGVELSHEMIQWRREKIAEIGPDAFRQEYPSTPEEAVQGTAGLLFPHICDCLVDDLPFDLNNVPHEDLVGGIDFGYHDPTVIWTGVYQAGVLWLGQYYRRAEGLAEDHVEGLVDGAMYYCDPSGLTDRKGLQQAAHDAGVDSRLVAAPRRKHAGEDIGTTEMKALIRFVETGRLRVTREAATQLLLEADNLAWNERTGKVGDVRTAECGHFDSLYALKYLVMGLEGQVVEAAPAAARQPTRRDQFARI